MIVEASATNKYLLWKDKKKACLSRAVLKLQLIPDKQVEVPLTTAIYRAYADGGRIEVFNENGDKVVTATLEGWNKPTAKEASK